MPNFEVGDLVLFDFVNSFGERKKFTAVMEHKVPAGEELPLEIGMQWYSKVLDRRGRSWIEIPNLVRSTQDRGFFRRCSDGMPNMTIPLNNKVIPYFRVERIGRHSKYNCDIIDCDLCRKRI